MMACAAGEARSCITGRGMVRLLPARSALAAVAFLLGCGGAPAAPPAAPVKACEALAPTLSVSASKSANPLASGEGRPVQVRVYQLKSDAKLRTASFEDIWQTDTKVLEGELLSVEQHTVFPGQTQSIAVAAKPEALYLAVVALFREPQGKDWFLTYELAPPKEQPPCPKKLDPIPIWIDRMQIQDGAGRSTEADDAAPAPANEGQ
jgi:type VI secretion system protein VasD